MKTTTGYLAICAFLFSILSIHQVAAVTSCACKGIPTPLLNDMCVCGCEPIKSAFVTYTKECPPALIANLEAYFAYYCKEEENTEDCKEFKALDGKITDIYKKCRDDLDSIHDDCEECKGCSF